jgi:hypothetical protein
MMAVSYPRNRLSDLRRTAHGVRTKGVDVLLATTAILIVMAPVLFTSSGLAPDFTNHLWLSWAAGESLVQAGHPSYFLNAEGVGVFDPFFAFYGGTLYAVTGGISDLLGGHPLIAFTGITMLAVAGSYLGMLWLGRELGIRGWVAHAPAVTVVTSAYYITDLYGRGAWSEFVAVAAIAPLVAACVHLLRVPAWRPWPVLVFAFSATIFTGSHNITLLWGAIVAVGALLLMWLTQGCPWHLPYRRLAMVAGLGMASILVNAWFLLPNIAYARDVAIYGTSPLTWSSTSFFNTPAVLLDPLRYVPSQSSTSGLYVQIPDWFLGWGLMAGVVLLSRRSMAGRLRRAWVGAVIVVVLLLTLIMLRPFWEHASFPFNQIQFPYRLGSYVFYAVAGLVLVGALVLQRAATLEASPRAVKGLRLALIAVAAVSAGLCLWQQWTPTRPFPNSYAHRSEVLASIHVRPFSWYDNGSFNDGQSPVVTVPGERFLIIPPELVHGDRFAAWMDLPPGPEPIQTNIAAGGYLAHISGVKRLGRGLYNYTVVRRLNGGSDPVRVVIETTHSPLIELGWILSILASIAILVVLGYTGLRTGRAHRLRS